MLLVDDHQRQVAELHLVLEQRVGADHHGRAGGDAFQCADAGLALELAGQPGDLDAQRLQPLAEGEEVLLGEDLGGRHQRHLVAGLQRLQRGQRGDHGLAGADVALHQAQHRLGLGQVPGDFRRHALLRAGGGEAEVGQVLRRQARGLGQLRRLLGAHALAQARQRQLVGQQFLEGQAVLGPVAALGQLLEVGVRRRPVQVADRLVERRQVVLAGQLGGQPVGQAAPVEAAQRLLAEGAQALLGEALGARVDRREGLLDRRRRLVGRQGAVLGVVDLQAGGAGAHLAVAAQVGAALEAVLLRLAEVEEAQAEGAAGVLQAHQQAAPAAEDDVGAAHHAFHHRIAAGAQGADRRHVGAVLVAQRQVEQHVLQGFQADLGQFLGQRRADALQRGDGDARQFGHAGCAASALSAACGGWVAEHRRTASTSTSMALGRGKLARQAMATLRWGTGGFSGRTSSTPGA
ncbi:hypothetical protein D3C78_976770 [compost metagenome]